MNGRKKVTEEESKKGIKEEQNIFENKSIELKPRRTSFKLFNIDDNIFSRRY